MSVETFEKRAGEVAMSDQPDGSVMTLLGEPAVPEWVRLPPDLGGRKVSVLRTGESPCALQGCGVHRKLVLDAPAPGGGNIAVMECAPSGRFFWFRET